MRLRVGLVGLGDSWRQRYAPALRALADRFEVRGVCDQVGHLADLAAGELHATAVDGYWTLARREDIDAILVLSSQWFAALPIVAACESGKDIYCAAGLVLSPGEPSEIKRRVERAGVAFTTGFPRRQAPATLRLKELIATRLGRPRLVFCHRRSVAEPFGVSPGGMKKNADGKTAGASKDSAARELVELVDWCRYVVGSRPVSVTGIVHPHECESGQEKYQMMSLAFADNDANSDDANSAGIGPIAQISHGRYFPAGWNEAMNYRPLAELQVACEHGVAFVDLPSTLVWFDEAGRHQESLDSERPVDEQLLMQFHRAATSLVRKTSDLEDAFLADHIVQQAQISYTQGKRIEL